MLWSLFGPFSVLLASFIANICISRMLPPGDLGVYFLIISFASVAGVIIQFGLARAGLALIARHLVNGEGGNARRLVRRILLVLLCSFGVFAICVYAIPGNSWKSIFGDFDITSYAIAGLIIVTGFIAFQNVTADLLRGMARIKAAVLVGGLVHAPLFAAIQIALLLSDANVNIKIIFGIYAASLALGGVIGAVLMNSRYKRLNLSGDPSSSSLKAIMNLALPLWIGNLTFLIQTQSDLWVINYFLSKEDVAVYGNAFRLALLLVIPLRALEGAVSQRIVAAHTRNDLDELRLIGRHIGLAAVGIALPLLAIFAIAPGSVMGLIYGEPYSHGGPVLLILVLGRFYVLPFTVNRLVLEICGYQRTAMQISVTSGIAHLLTSIYLCSIFGVLGAAAANSIVFAAEKTISAVIVREKLGLWLFAGYDRGLLRTLR